VNGHLVLGFLLELNHWDLNHPLTGRGYQAWSGAISDISEVTLPIGVAAFYLQHTCKASHWCPFVAKHPVNGTTASVCPMHHTAQIHKRLQRRHERKHGHRLSHGDSPDYASRHQ
jgi:hypothetical protein